MVRVGVDVGVRDELLEGFPAGTEFVRIPAKPVEPLDVDVWLLPFFRQDAPEVFQHLRGVKVVQSLMAGVDWILPWLPKEIVLCDGRGIHDTSTSEYVLAAILASLKRFPVYRDRQLRQEWRSLEKTGDELLDSGGDNTSLYRVLQDDLSGKTVLIVGFGSIGAAIERRLKAFDVNVLRLARTARAEPVVHPVSALRELLPQADVVVLIVPMTQETKGLIGAEELALMKHGALLVNASRGPVVVTDALVAALEEERIRAVLDVMDPEPLPIGHPLWTAPNCFITPHIGGATPLFIRRGFRLAAEQVRRFAAGEPLDNVVKEDGY
jgi:phosphoglycerate dehydrogenase-like enzyme